MPQKLKLLINAHLCTNCTAPSSSNKQQQQLAFKSAAYQRTNLSAEFADPIT